MQSHGRQVVPDGSDTLWILPSFSFPLLILATLDKAQATECVADVMLLALKLLGLARGSKFLTYEVIQIGFQVQ